MKKIKLFLPALIIAGILIPLLYTLVAMGTFSKSPKVEIKNVVPEDAPVLRVVADFDFSPYSFYDSSDNITGLEVELINEIANRLGMKAEIILTDWISCKKLLQAKDADLILGLEIFSNMDGVLKTTAVSKDQLLVFGKTKINDIAALSDKRVGLIANSIIEKIYDLNCEYVPFYTNTQILDSIEDNQIDFGICHGSVAKKILKKRGYKIYPSISLMNSYPAIGVRDDLPELRDSINKILTQLSNEGFINKIDDKWLLKFTEKLTIMDVFQKNVKIFLTYFILFVITVSIILFFQKDIKHKEIMMKNNLQYQNSLKKQNDMLTSIAKIYFTMHAINLVDDTVRELHSEPQIKNYVNKIENAVFQMHEVIENTVVPEDVELALKFTDLKTLSQRMENKKSILAEFRGTEIGWFCAQFIATDYNEAGEVTDVIFTTQSIDEMKKENERLLRLSHYDELTHMLNRHAYDAKLKDLKEKNENKITIVVFDVNSLKKVNDQIGHQAGDELISGAALCISEVFNNCGTCYRMGGDEFLVLSEGEMGDMNEKLELLKVKTAEWKGNFTTNLKISAGFASYTEIPDFTLDKFKELEHMADKKMYADKNRYYKEMGIDRRK